VSQNRAMSPDNVNNNVNVQDAYQPQSWSIANADPAEITEINIENVQNMPFDSAFGSEVLGAVVGMPESVTDNQLVLGQTVPVSQNNNLTQSQENGYVTGQGSYYNILETDLVQTRLRLARTAEALAHVTAQRDSLLNRLVEYVIL